MTSRLHAGIIVYQLRWNANIIIIQALVWALQNAISDGDLQTCDMNTVISK